MNKKVPQSLVLHTIISELSKYKKNVSGDSLLSDLMLPMEAVESLRMRFTEKLGLPEFSDKILSSVPTIFDMQDETPPFNPEADMCLSVRSLSVSITLWYMEKHRQSILALTSN